MLGVSNCSTLYNFRDFLCLNNVEEIIYVFIV